MSWRSTSPARELEQQPPQPLRETQARTMITTKRKYGKKRSATTRAILEEKFLDENSPVPTIEEKREDDEAVSRDENDNDTIVVSLKEVKPGVQDKKESQQESAKTQNSGVQASSEKAHSRIKDQNYRAVRAGTSHQAATKSTRRGALRCTDITSSDSRTDSKNVEQKSIRRFNRRENSQDINIETALESLTLADTPKTDDNDQAGSNATYSQPHLELPKSKQHLLPILQESNQNYIEPFRTWASEITKNYDIVKQAEGSYGEVFKVLDKSQDSSAGRYRSLRALGGCILKVIPINAATGPGSRKFSHARDVAKEIQMLKTMDAVHGFTRFRDVYLLEGKMQGAFVDAWRAWKEKPGNECFMNDPLDYSDKQIWAVVEMDDAGADLETLKTPSICEVYDIFWSVTLSLAYGEMIAEFEHRDLHIGNICYRPFQPSAKKPSSRSSLHEQPSTYFGLSNLRTTIIDYTLSRAVVASPTGSDAEQQQQQQQSQQIQTIGHTPLNKTQIFSAEGTNPEEILQRETARRMYSTIERAAAAAASSTSPTKPTLKSKRPSKPKPTNSWAEHYTPQTNVLWLSYLLEVLLNRAATTPTTTTTKSSSSTTPNPTLLPTLQKRLRSTHEALLNLLILHPYSEATAAAAAAPTSAADLIDRAVREGWVDQADLEAWKNMQSDE